MPTRSSVRLLNRADSSSHSFEDNGNEPGQENDSSDNQHTTTPGQDQDYDVTGEDNMTDNLSTGTHNSSDDDLATGDDSNNSDEESLYLKITDMELVDNDLEVMDKDAEDEELVDEVMDMEIMDEVVDKEIENHTQPFHIHLPQLVWIL